MSSNDNVVDRYKCRTSCNTYLELCIQKESLLMAWGMSPVVGLKSGKTHLLEWGKSLVGWVSGKSQVWWALGKSLAVSMWGM